MMLKDVTVLDSEPRLGQEHCFNLYDGKKAVLVAATSHAEKLSWMEDIAEAAQVNFLSESVLMIILSWGSLKRHFYRIHQVVSRIL